MQKKSFKIDGMHCKSCKTLIETEIEGIEGIKKIEVDHVKGMANIEFDEEKTDIKEIFSNIKKLNYEPSLLEITKPTVIHGEREESRDAQPNNKSFLIGLLIPVIILALVGVYLIAREFGGFEILAKLNETNVSYGIILLIGLLAGFHCVGMCGGLVVAYSAGSLKEDQKKRFAPHLQYNFGRIISYSIVGGLLGGVGSFFAINPTFTGAVILIAGIFMILMGMSFVFKWEILKKIKLRTPEFIAKFLYKNKGRKGPFIVGLLNVLMPCGPLQAMQLYALTTGSVTRGALSLGIYALGTTPLMLGFGAFISTLGSKHIKRVIKFSGVLIIVLGLFMANRGLANFGLSIGIGEKSVSKKEYVVSGEIQEYQTVEMDVTYFGYKPNVLYVKKDVPVRWVINGKEITGCTNAIQIPSLGIKKDLIKGENIIEFTPTEVGEIKFSCWMSMVWGKFIVTENDYNPTGIELQNEAVNLGAESAGCGGGCGTAGCTGGTSAGCGCGRIRVE